MRLRFLSVFLVALATQLVLQGVRAAVDGVVGVDAFTDAVLVAAALFGVAVGACFDVSARVLAVVVAVFAGVFFFAIDHVDVVLNLVPAVRVVVVALVIAAATAPLGALVGVRVGDGSYVADLVGSAVGALAGVGLAAVAGVNALVAAAAVAAVIAALHPAPPSSPSAPPSSSSPDIVIALVLAAAVGLLEPLVPRLLAPATAGGPWVLSVVVAAALVGGATGVRARVRGGAVVTAAIVFVAIAGGADLWRGAVIAVLCADAGVTVRLVVAAVVIGAPVAAAAAASGNAFAAVANARVFAAASAVAGVAALASAAVASAAPEVVVAVAGIVVATTALATARGALVVVVFSVIVVGVTAVVVPPRGFASHDLTRALLLGDAKEADDADIVVDERDASGRTVVVNADDVTLYRDGKPDASLGGDVETQALLAILPLMYAPEARSAVVVGLGSGATARWLADAGVNVDVAEISPAVANAVGSFGEGALPPNVTVHLGDARSTVRALRADVVTVEASNAFVGGSARLFSVQALRTWQAASKSGVVVTWAHAYLADDDVLGVIAASANAVFAAVDVYATNDGDVFFVGRPADTAPDPWTVEGRLGPRVACALAALHLPSLDLLPTGARKAPTTMHGPHDDRQPRLLTAATAALLRKSTASWGVTAADVDVKAGVIDSLGVTDRLRTAAGRASLAREANTLRLTDDDITPPWAPPLARAGLALLGDGTSVDDLVEALRLLSLPRCAQTRDVDLALEIAKRTLLRQPSSSTKLLPALQRLPLRRATVATLTHKH